MAIASQFVKGDGGSGRKTGIGFHGTFFISNWDIRHNKWRNNENRHGGNEQAKKHQSE